MQTVQLFILAFQGLLTVAGFMAGFIIKSMNNRIDKLEISYKELEIDVRELKDNYLDRFNRVIQNQCEAKDEMIHEQSLVKESLIKEQTAVKESLIKEQTAVKESLIKEQNNIKEELIKNQTIVKEELIKEIGQIRLDIAKIK